MKRIFSFLLCAVLLLNLCGCNIENIKNAMTPTLPTGESAVTVTDMIGREVTVIPGSYQKVICIGAGALRMYSYVGDVSLLCGVEDIDNETLSQRPQMFDSVARPYVLAHGDTFQTLPSCGVGGPSAQAPEEEKIRICEPDIIISEYEDVTVADNLQNTLGVPVITLKAGVDGVFDNAFSGSMTLLGKVFGREAQAAALISFVAEQRAAIESVVASIPQADKPSVYICGLGNWGTTNHLMTAENYISFRIAGVENAVNGLGIQGVGPIEEEKFREVTANADIMIIDAAAIKNMKPLYTEDPAMFSACKPWQEDQVYLQMAYNAYYTNYEIALINTWFIAKSVYPEQFRDVDMTAKTNEITKMFLGQELAEEIFACPNSFGGYQQINTATFFG